jgi:hypothetical protein
MRMFRRESGGLVGARFTAEEAGVLRQLALELLQLLDGAGTDAAADAAATDPALARLLPDAYRDDAEAAAEFRRFTSEDLAGRKMDNARAVVAALDGAEAPRRFAALGEIAVRLDDAAALSWMRSLTDMRLALAARLGIDDEDEMAPWARMDPQSEAVRNVYDWLAAVQDGLVRAVDR